MVTDHATGTSTSAPVTAPQEQQTGMVPMPPRDGPLPRTGEPPPRNHSGAPPNYPPPSSAPGSFQQQNPYQAAQQSYPLPSQGNFPPQNFPPYGYPGPPVFSAGGPPQYGSQQPPPFFGGSGYPPGFPQQSLHEKSEQQGGDRQKSTPSRRNASPSKSPRGRPHPHPPVAPPPPHHHPLHRHKSPLEVEMKRQQAAASDFSSSVAPMRSAFHFFVDDHAEKLRQLAIEEVKKSSNRVDIYLVNTNLNSRLINEWENAEESVREKYLEKEEEDRKRFMAADEIASRHCATLTARARSPKFEAQVNNVAAQSGKRGKTKAATAADDKSGESSRKEEKRESSTENGESPTKKSRKNDGKES